MCIYIYIDTHIYAYIYIYLLDLCSLLCSCTQSYPAVKHKVLDWAESDCTLVVCGRGFQIDPIQSERLVPCRVASHHRCCLPSSQYVY